MTSPITLTAVIITAFAGHAQSMRDEQSDERVPKWASCRSLLFWRTSEGHLLMICCKDMAHAG